MKATKKKICAICFILILSLILSVTSFETVYADESETDEAINMYGFNRKGNYTDYLEKYKDVSLADDVITVDAASVINKEDKKIVEEFEGRQGVLLCDREEEAYDFEIDVKKSGMYSLHLDYYPLDSLYNQITIQVEIDGKVPFEEAKSINIERLWNYDEEIKQDSRGNDILPNQKVQKEWIRKTLYDNFGIFNEPLKFHLEEGKRKITITTKCADFYLDQISFFNAEEPIPYQEYIEKAKSEGAVDAENIIIKIEGEKPSAKSDSMVMPIYDRSSPANSPSDPVKMKYNVMGGENWRYPGHWIEWEFEVPEDGFYNIGFRAKQDMKHGFISYRKVYIDGVPPFEEGQEIKFKYSSDWKIYPYGDENPYKVYLTKGKHTLRLEASIGRLSESFSSINDAIYKLNYVYRDIIMITSTNPDTLRDYQLAKQIPDLIENLEEILEILKAEKIKLKENVGIKNSDLVNIEKLIIQIEDFIRFPETIPSRLWEFKSNISGLSSWLFNIREQPLKLDYIIIKSPDEAFPKARANIFKRIIFGIQSFIGSFNYDYSIIGDASDEENAITVWTDLGRDQLQIIKQMIDNQFTPKTGIPVNLKLVQAGLVQAILAGKGPDVALNCGSYLPVNLALRGALVDLSQFDDFSEVAERFYPSAIAPFEFNGGYYALPQTQYFPMMFYRKDIFQALNIEPPETWEEFMKIAPIIQRKNMFVGLPNIDYGMVNAVTGIGPGQMNNSMFAMFLLQNGGKFYNEDRSRTLFDQEEAIEAFNFWTKLYTDYGFPERYEFFNSFRSGEMPLAIANYGTYTQLVVAAPEISGLWEMKPVPYTIREDGTKSRAVQGFGECVVMLKQSKKQKEAWEFMKWFTDEEAQAFYGNSLEILQGTGVKYATANRAAFEKLSWESDERKALKDQWKEVAGVPISVAEYHVGRHITNAFRKVTQDGENPKQALLYYNKEINKEIQRKLQQYGLISVDLD